MQGKRLASITVLCLVLIGVANPVSAQVSYWSNFLAYDGVHYLTAENGGGTSFNDKLVADRTVAATWELIEVVDTDGGSLLDGDHVILKSVNGAALGGTCSGPGNSVFAWGSVGCLWGGQYYHFWIYKAGGSGGNAIASGDQVIMYYDSGYSIIADWGGGSTVRLGGTWGPHETFTITY